MSHLLLITADGYGSWSRSTRSRSSTARPKGVRFSREQAPEDLLQRTELIEDGEVVAWVETIYTPSGNRALWNYSGFASADRAIEWLKEIER
jgi:hypothetical protein